MSEDPVSPDPNISERLFSGIIELQGLANNYLHENRHRPNDTVEVIQRAILHLPASEVDVNRSMATILGSLRAQMPSKASSSHRNAATQATLNAPQIRATPRLYLLPASSFMKDYKAPTSSWSSVTSRSRTAYPKSMHPDMATGSDNDIYADPPVIDATAATPAIGVEARADNPPVAGPSVKPNRKRKNPEPEPAHITNPPVHRYPTRARARVPAAVVQAVQAEAHPAPNAVVARPTQRRRVAKAEPDEAPAPGRAKGAKVPKATKAVTRVSRQ
ncbi:hypothetical protein FA15DRAFT_731318 [Coprinopsis marcescibilis]|uniref:Uncharacterized protein n=1 Tax=Coprinopsis marcescibilis TaxID=230819 RepID=A0A5C3KDL6_COPMA|nr:hypothetical protein FA15DRAFT_731318 [Coprinopsis marcescibilis]